MSQPSSRCWYNFLKSKVTVGCSCLNCGEKELLLLWSIPYMTVAVCMCPCVDFWKYVSMCLYTLSKPMVCESTIKCDTEVEHFTHLHTSTHTHTHMHIPWQGTSLAEDLNARNVQQLCALGNKLWTKALLFLTPKMLRTQLRSDVCAQAHTVQWY